MPRYHSLLLSPNMSLTVEGYLICKNVPICRTGSQEYYGRELKGFPGYQDSWDLDPDKKYKVERPRDEVLHRDTIASFEGKTVVDEHPTNDGAVVHVDNERELHCGHIQNVKEGPPIRVDGHEEFTLQGDLIIKNPELIEKIRPEEDPESGRVRDVSCGYTLKLKRLGNGTLVMYDIRGNHVAVVEKGRAGNRIAIKDSAPPEITQRKDTIMNVLDAIFGRGLKAYAAEATPEELVGLSRAMATDSKEPAMDKKPQPGEPAMDKKPHHMAAHDALDRCLDAMKDPKKMGCDAFGHAKDMKGLKKELLDYLPEDEKDEKKEVAEDAEKVEELKDAEPDMAEDAELKQDEKTAAEEDDEMTTDSDMGNSTDKINDLGKSVLKAATDSVVSFIKSSRPIVALIVAKPKSKRTSAEKNMVDSYNTAVRNMNTSRGNGYSALAKTKTPDGIPPLATDSFASGNKVDDVNVSEFYEGVPHSVGKKRHADYLAQKGSK